ncbi:MAG: HAMP domain-containing histidine kinase [Proteobacteria bacterium]|nr:MAG: HAMP domain-containing histidine kinase [Pseudomonadota bacterium]
MALNALREGAEVLESAKEEAEAARENAEIANRAKSEFLSRMSHELRTPLNAIIGFGQILAMHCQEEEVQQQDNIQQILKAGRHLLNLINEVLDIARIEAGHLSLSQEPIPVYELAQEILHLVHPLALARDIDLVNEMPLEYSARYALADQQRFKQVLLNLLSNAVKYNRHGGQVSVGCEVVNGPPIIHNGFKCQGNLRLLVKDTGTGLTAEEMTRLFVPFERLSAARTQIEGSGIGLALCKKILDNHKGFIHAESVAGEGATFHMYFPAH